MIFPKTLTLRLILNFWGVFGAFLGNFWELFKRSNLLAAVYPYNFIQTMEDNYEQNGLQRETAETESA